MQVGTYVPHVPSCRRFQESTYAPDFIVYHIFHTETTSVVVILLYAPYCWSVGSLKMILLTICYMFVVHRGGARSKYQWCQFRQWTMRFSSSNRHLWSTLFLKRFSEFRWCQLTRVAKSHLRHAYLQSLFQWISLIFSLQTKLCIVWPNVYNKSLRCVIQN
jgi:hypothetical protein